MRKAELAVRISKLEAMLANQQKQIDELQMRFSKYGPTTPQQWPTPWLSPLKVTCEALSR